MKSKFKLNIDTAYRTELRLALGWLVGSMCILSGLWLSMFYFVAGLALAFAGLVLWPPSRAWVFSKLPVTQLLSIQAAVLITFLVIALFGFIGRYLTQLEQEAHAQGYESVEEYQRARQHELEN